MFIKKLEQISAADVTSAGGKGSSLGEMMRVGIPVPPGFVVGAEAFEQLLKRAALSIEIESILRNVDRQVVHELEEASRKIRTLIEEAEMPAALREEIEAAFADLGVELVAVRSSATSEDSIDAAWAGQLETYLNTTSEQLLVNVKKCWSSLFTPRALLYRYEKGLLDTPISVAVVIQKMVQSEMAGVAFSVHPVTQDPNQLIIEAGAGLGEAVVSGEVTPDSYVVNKETNAILENRGAEAILSEEQVLFLARMVKRIESHFRFPVDVEWAYAEEAFFITQSRPITTLTPKKQESADEMHFGHWEYWTEEAHIPLFILSDHRLVCFSDDFLSLYQAGTSLLFLTKHRWEREGNIGRNAFCGENFLTTYAENANKTIQRISASRSPATEHFLEELLQLYIEWQLVYFETDPPRTSLVTSLNMSPETLSEIADIRLRLRNVAEEVLFPLTEALLEEMFTLYGVTYHDLCFYTYTEFKALLDHQQQVDQNILDARHTGYVFFREQGKERLLVGDEFKVISLAHEKWVHDQCAGRILSGSVANQGFVTGQVQVIKNNLHDLSEVVAGFIPGRILVTEMTRPQTLSACRQAAAIITDEGGVTCHASIISREYGIPCIVGTKIATRMLKDGDMVEVDANNGVIRII